MNFSWPQTWVQAQMTCTSGVHDWIFHLLQKNLKEQFNREDLFSLFHLTLFKPNSFEKEAK